MAKRFIALFLCITFAVSSVLVTPASAASAQDDGGGFLSVDFFNWIFEGGYHTMATIFSAFFDEVCPSAPGLTSKHSFVKKHTMVDGKTGMFYICEYCGRSAGEVGKQTYDDQVDNLPAPGINSAGRLIWQPTVSDIYFGPSAPEFALPWNKGYHRVSSLPFTKTSGSDVYYTLSATDSGNGLVQSFSYEYSGWYFDAYKFYLVAPITGAYRRGDFICSFKGFSRAGATLERVIRCEGSTALSSFGAGENIQLPFSFVAYDSGTYVVSGTATAVFPVYEIIPDDALGTEYNPDTRPPSIPGPIGIIGDDGTINEIDNSVKIIDEDNRIIYNPVTDTTYNINDWTYNYDNRTYDITVDDSTHITVTYGDENITINEGDTIYNIYYITEGSGDDPSPTPGPCLSHDWRESSRVEPGCTSPGRVNYTCSKCGQTKTEALNALGHTWQVERVVNTTYDEDGNVIQQGYTIYQCAACGEQYKDTDSTGPPGPPGPVEDGGLGAFLDNLIKQLLDNLSGAVDLILSFFEKIPRLFGGFLDFLSAMFPYLPEDVIFLFTFGMAAVVFIGVLRWLRR